MMHSWRHVTECDDDDLPPGWGDDPEDEEDVPNSGRQANSMDENRTAGCGINQGLSKGSFTAAEPRLGRRPLPSLFTHVPLPAADATVAGKGQARPPRPPSQYQPPWTIRDRRARSVDGPPRKRATATSNLPQESEEQRASSEGARQARAALEQLRASKRRAPLEETLERLKALERTVKVQKEHAKAEGASLPPLPRESAGRSRRESADARSLSGSAARTGRRSLQSSQRSGSRTLLPELREKRGRAASAPPAATEGLNLASLVAQGPGSAPTKTLHEEFKPNEHVAEID
mmetsp:Transcript_76633/g.135824  ORF Transcript_76633/g.135824 Transcript_76633/m.135824 type:complete len:290 (+) Transcript_76633:85-954(+)